MKYINYLIISIGLMFPGAVLAADYPITLCNVQASGGSNKAYIRPCGGWVSKNNCTANGWIEWDASKFLGAAMYSTALAGLTTGKTITVRMDGVSCGHYDVTNMLRIHK